MIPQANRFTPFQEWVELFRVSVGGGTSIPEWQGQGWREWVDAFREAADGDEIDVPRQTEFSEFEAWADDFIRRNE
jgi:hypothetical protein